MKKILNTTLFCFACLLAFLLAAAVSCALRAKYSALPSIRAELADMYAANMQNYSFLQYRQASPDQGTIALLLYLKLLQRIKDQGIRYPESTLHFQSGLAYLRLYRLESIAGDSTAAGGYMRSAQKECSALGWKDVSTESLVKLIETRELNEAKLYNSSELPVPTAEEKPEKSKEKTE